MWWKRLTRQIRTEIIFLVTTYHSPQLQSSVHQRCCFWWQNPCRHQTEHYASHTYYHQKYIFSLYHWHCSLRKKTQGIRSLDTEANSCTVSAASEKSLQDDFFTGDRRGGMGKERKRLSRHTRVIKNGSSSFLIQSYSEYNSKGPSSRLQFKNVNSKAWKHLLSFGSFCFVRFYVVIGFSRQIQRKL